MLDANDEYKIVKMTQDDLNVMINYAISVGWAETHEAIESYYSIDPDGFFKGIIGDEIVATISAVRYPENFAFMGYYIVVPNHRKKGYGLKIFQKALEHCEGCIIGLDAVQERVESYKKSGFVPTSNSIRYNGTSAKTNVDMNILQYDESKHFEDIALYDKDCFPGCRKEFLRSWLKIKDSKSCVFYNDKNELNGYASIHKTNKGWEIAPCFADSSKIAKALIAFLVNNLDEGVSFGVNIPDNNKEAVDLTIELNDIYHFEKIFSDPRMFKNGFPTNLNPHKFYSLLSLAVG